MDVGRVLAQIFCDGFSLFVEDVSQDDLGSFFDEKPSFAFSLPPRCTRDDGNLAFESSLCHGLFAPSSFRR